MGSKCLVLRVLAWGSDEAYVAMRSKSSRYGGGVVCKGMSTRFSVTVRGSRYLAIVLFPWGFVCAGSLCCRGVLEGGRGRGWFSSPVV